MKKKCVPILIFATLATFAFAGVTVSTPSNGSTVSSSVHYLAYGSSPACPKGIGGMGIYTAPYKLAYKVSGSKIDTTLNLSAGTYNTVVQQWDNCGWSAIKAVQITVGSKAQTTTSSSTGGVFANLQSDSHWNHYSLLPPSYGICGSCTPSGPALTYSTQQGISSPSLTGRSMKFTIGGTMPFSDALWNQKFTSRLGDAKWVPNYHDFVYDVWFYGTDLEKSQALEWDINQFFDGKSFIWGHECRIASGHEWDTWNNVTMHWVKSGIPCNPKSNYWNHLTIHVQRTSDNHLFFKSITLNGVTHSANRYDTPTKTNWYGMTINYQQDGNKYQQTYSVYQDKFSFTYK
jgi:hypothetical protein